MNRKGRAPGRGHRFWRNRAGNVTPLFAVMLVPIVAMVGMAGETSSWFLTQRAAQNTADQAALAAAANNCATGASCATNGTTFVQEAAAVARKYNFVNGASETTVTADIAPDPTTPCASSTCYRVTIQRKSPINLLRVTGYKGTTTTTVGNRPAVNIFASATARRVRSDSMFCVTTLSNKSDSFNVNGGPNLDLSTCTIFAPNGGARCNGTSGTKVQGSEVAQSNGQACGAERITTRGLLDPFDALKSNLPNSDSVCPPDSKGVRYWQETKNSTPPAANIVKSGAYSLSSPICGDAVLTGNVTLAGDNVLLIENGHLNLNTYTLQTAPGGSLTIIFSGTTTSTADHFVTGTGTLDYSAAPGTWAGVAMYQDPRLTSNVNFTYAGNSPDFNITGLIYAPKADVTISGAIDHATQGLACLSFFVNTLLANGTASIFATPTRDCNRLINTGGVQTLEKVALVYDPKHP